MCKEVNCLACCGLGYELDRSGKRVVCSICKGTRKHPGYQSWKKVDNNMLKEYLIWMRYSQGRPTVNFNGLRYLGCWRKNSSISYTGIKADGFEKYGAPRFGSWEEVNASYDRGYR